MKPAAIVDDNFEYFDLTKGQEKRLESELVRAGFKLKGLKEAEFNVFPEPLPPNYHLDDGLPAPVGYFAKEPESQQTPGGYFCVQYIGVDSLKQYTEKLLDICEKL